MRILFLLLFCFLFGIDSMAQSGGVSGIVLSNDNLPVPGAGIYIRGYKHATVTDSDGKFAFPILPPGNYDILVKMVGFIPEIKTVSIKSSVLQISVHLKESLTSVAEVTIEPGVKIDTQRYYKIFRSAFIGNTNNAAKCKILNPEVLEIRFSKLKSLLTVSSDDFLIVENAALGYRIKFLLKKFEYNIKDNTILYEGFPFFEEMEASLAKKRRWEDARTIAYNGSTQHFYRSLFDNTTKNEGFIIKKVEELPLTDEREVLIRNRIKRLKANADKIPQLMLKDSLAYWTGQLDAPIKGNIFMRDVSVDTLVHTRATGHTFISFTGSLFVIYTKEKELSDFRASGYSLERPAAFSYDQASKIRMKADEIIFYSNGDIENPTSAEYSGYWAYEKIADLVPLDYQPATNKKNSHEN